ncbi:M20 family metallopeptidase [Martelella sp. AMO21009]
MSAAADHNARPAEGETAALVAELVSIESLSGQEAAVQAFIADWFGAEGIATRLEPAADGLVNVVVEIDGAGPGQTLWIGGHCDVVGVGDGWSRDPFVPVIGEGRLYGRGTMDMKGGLAAAMLTARDMYRMRTNWAGRFIFASLSDEEAYSRGAEAHVANCGQIDGAIMCEPHFSDVVIGALGKVNLVVEVQGLAAHASHPEKGINAVIEAGRLLALIGDLKRTAEPTFGTPSHCVIGIESGDGTYSISVPDRCRFTINWHFLPSESAEGAVSLIRDLADSLASPAKFDITARSPSYDGYLLDRDLAFVNAFSASYRLVLGAEPRLEIGRGVSDANILAGRAGIPTLLFGPSGGNMHGPDEWVDLIELEKVRSVYLDFARRFLASKTD